MSAAKQLTPHFSLAELSCRCGCGGHPTNPELFRLLEATRLLYGRPINITSGFRCAAHNAAVGGATFSAHLAGWAVDVACETPGMRAGIFEAAHRAGFTRLGIANTFIHMDCDPGKTPHVVWLY